MQKNDEGTCHQPETGGRIPLVHCFPNDKLSLSSARFKQFTHPIFNKIITQVQAVPNSIS